MAASVDGTAPPLLLEQKAPNLILRPDVVAMHKPAD